MSTKEYIKFCYICRWFFLVLKLVHTLSIFIFILDNSSIFEVINECFTTCNNRGIDHYRNKNQGNQIDHNAKDTTTQESSENEVNNVIY